MSEEELETIFENDLSEITDKIEHFKGKVLSKTSKFNNAFINKCIEELSSKIHDIQDEKNDLISMFKLENKRFNDLIEKLSDKVRLISISVVEMESKIKILNSKLPELEDIYERQNKTINMLIDKKQGSSKETKILESQVKNTEKHIKELETEIMKIEQRNCMLKIELETITQESENVQTSFKQDKKLVKDNINKCEEENIKLEKTLNQINQWSSEKYNDKLNIINMEITIATDKIEQIKSENYAIKQENLLLKKIFRA